MTHKRKPFVCANWKLNHNLAKSLKVIEETMADSKDLNEVDLVIAPVVTVLSAACDKTQNSSIRIAAQNVFYESKGAFTGEWSASHLSELGCAFAIVGHSERRQYFAETDTTVAKKVLACFENGLTPIACVGESIEERKSGRVKSVLKRQVDAVISLISREQTSSLVIAYEPIWAIGTGLSASIQEAQEAHAFIRGVIEEKFGAQTAQNTRILYGGSVKPENVNEFSAAPDVDGALVGGASLESDSFLRIARGFLNKVS